MQEYIFNEQLVVKKIEPTADLVGPIANLSNHPKPEGGLWTSSALESGGIDSEWTDWLENERQIGIEKTWRLKVSSDAKVFHIDSIEKERKFIEEYRAPLPEEEWEQKLQSWTKAGLIDWEKVAQDFDGVRWQRYSGFDRMESPFSMWDVESTWWSRWSFENVELACERRGVIKDIDHEELDLENIPANINMKDALDKGKGR